MSNAKRRHRRRPSRRELRLREIDHQLKTGDSQERGRLRILPGEAVALSWNAELCRWEVDGNPDKSIDTRPPHIAVSSQGGAVLQQNVPAGIITISPAPAMTLNFVHFQDPPPTKKTIRVLR